MFQVSPSRHLRGYQSFPGPTFPFSPSTQSSVARCSFLCPIQLRLLTPPWLSLSPHFAAPAANAYSANTPSLSALVGFSSSQHCFSYKGHSSHFPVSHLTLTISDVTDTTVPSSLLAGAHQAAAAPHLACTQLCAGGRECCYGYLQLWSQVHYPWCISAGGQGVSYPLTSFSSRWLHQHFTPATAYAFILELWLFRAL